MKKFEKYQILKIAADQSGGVFSSLQAEEAGFKKQHHHLKIKSGAWERVGYGLYRLTDSDEAMSEIGAALLWTKKRGRLDIEGVISHGAAFHLWDLCEYVSHSIDISVPFEFRRRTPTPAGVVLHFEELSTQEITQLRGVKQITTPWRTLKDCYAKQIVTPDYLESFYMRARCAFLISVDDITHQTKGLPDDGIRFFERLENKIKERRSAT